MNIKIRSLTNFFSFLLFILFIKKRNLTNEDEH